jgi:uncharacterized protein
VSGFDARLSGDSVRFSVRLQPRSSRNEIVGVQGISLKVRVTAPPVDGMANEALIDLISELLKTPRRNVCIVSGLTSRTKMIEVRGVDLESVQHLSE